MKRADLYALVWTKPVTHVAKEFGISDVAVRKICVKHGIPTPPLGYWAKLQSGKKVAQPALLPPRQGEADHVDLHMRPKAHLPVAVVEANRVAQQEEAREESRIIVPAERPVKLHSLAAATEKALRKAKPDDEGFITSQGAGRIDARIGPGSIERVVLLIHSLVHAALDRGHQLSADPDFRIIVDEQPLAVRIYETKDKTPHVPTATELKRQAEEDEWRARYPSTHRRDHKAYRTWDYSPSGRLVMEISDPKQVRWQSDPIVGRWRDRTSTRLEDYLGETMVALKTGAAVARHQRAKEAEEARLAKEAEQRRREQEVQRRLLEKVTKFLMEKADKHAQIVKLENLAAHFSLDSVRLDGEPLGELQAAMAFVLANLRNQLSAEAVTQEIVSRRLLDPDSWY
jgi:hypothetical protein